MLGKSSSTRFQLCHVTSAKVSAFLEHAITNIIITNIVIFILIIILIVNVVVVDFNFSTVSTNTYITVLLFNDG